MPAPLVVARFAEGEGYVAVFDHVLDLSSHCSFIRIVSVFILSIISSCASLISQPPPRFSQTFYLGREKGKGIKGQKGKGEHTRQTKQNNKIHHQHGPKHGHIKDLEPRRQKAQDYRPRTRMPELELGQAPDEGAELLVLLRGQRGGRVGAVFQTFVLRERGVEFRL